jgi:hypothetical protein
LRPHEDTFGLQREDAAGSREIRAGHGKRAQKGDRRDAADLKRRKFDGEVPVIQMLETSQPLSGS